MKQLKKINIKAIMSAKPLLLLAIWFFLIIIPFYILNISIDAILKESEERLITKVKTQLVEDISLFQSDVTSDLKNEYDFTREILTIKSYGKGNSEVNSIPLNKIEEKYFYKFLYDKNGLSIFAPVSDKILHRLRTQKDFINLNKNQLYENKPVLKVTVDKKALEHPMRAIVNKIKFPTILLILFATLGLIKIAIYGYITNIRFLTKVILCVSAAVVLPFSSFIFAVYYNHCFSEEYSENELQHYTRIQTAVIKKAIEAYVENKELAIAELQNGISGFTKEQLHDCLTKWLNKYEASVILYSYKNDNEIQIKGCADDTLSTEAKNTYLNLKSEFNNSFTKLNSLKDNSLDNRMENNSKVSFIPSNIDKIINNTCRIFPIIKNEPSSLFAFFPIYEDEIKATKLVGTVFIKFDSYKILSSLKNHMPSLFRKMIMGNYVVKNAVLPIIENGVTPNNDMMLLSDDFKIEDISQNINLIISKKSQKDWITSSAINSATYLSKVNALLVSKAEKVISEKESIFVLNINVIILYIVMMIIALSVMLYGFILSPIRKLQNASVQIANGNFSNKIEWQSGDEFETLCNAFNNMTQALEQKEKMTNYVSKTVIEDVISNTDSQLQPSGERINIAVIFCALKGERALNQYLPKEVTDIISTLIDISDEISTSFNGQIDKLVEDTVMIVFRKTKQDENIVLNACKTALLIRERIKKELPDFNINIGIASGEAVSGKIGSRNGKLDYTVIGYAVNLAARLKILAYKAKNTGILIDPNSIRQIHGACRLNFIERINVKGINNRTFPLYELLDFRDN